MDRISYRMVVLLATVLACAAPGRSGPTRLPESAPPLDLRQVALFPNGLGFFVGEVMLPVGETSTRFLLPAPPSQGTFWLSYPPQIRLTRVVARKVKAAGKMLDAATIPQILKANLGQEVQLTVDKKKVITGRIIGFTEEHNLISPLPLAAGGPADRAEIVPPFVPGLVLLDVNGGTFCLDPRSIQHVLFPAGAVQRRVAETTETVEVHVQTDRPTDGTPLTVSFLGKGITWTPGYLVDLSGPKRARLSAQALIVNETYDLNEVATQLVTGFPHVQYAEIFSPIGMEQSLRDFLAALGLAQPPGPTVSHRAYAMAAQAEAIPRGAAPAVPPAYGAAAEGVRTGSLFLYPAGQLSLAKDRVAYVPLFTETVPYEQFYKWAIPATTDEAGRFLAAPAPPSGPEKEQEVWHTLRLQNMTRIPWAAAPAEIVKNSMLLGQDTLAYTAPGDKTTVRITRALDIKAEQQELEVSRTRGAAQINKVQYDLVTVRGELSATNFRPEPITLEIAKTLWGEVQSTDPPAQIEALATALKQMNPVARLTWTLTLNPSEKRIVTYTYQVYVRS